MSGSVVRLKLRHTVNVVRTARGWPVRRAGFDTDTQPEAPLVTIMYARNGEVSVMRLAKHCVVIAPAH